MTTEYVEFDALCLFFEGAPGYTVTAANETDYISYARVFSCFRLRMDISYFDSYPVHFDVHSRGSTHCARDS